MCWWWACAVQSEVPPGNVCILSSALFQTVWDSNTSSETKQATPTQGKARKTWYGCKDFLFIQKKQGLSERWGLNCLTITFPREMPHVWCCGPYMPPHPTVCFSVFNTFMCLQTSWNQYKCEMRTPLVRLIIISSCGLGVWCFIGAEDL